MNVKRNYPCNHDGKLYGQGDIVEVPDEIGERWVKSGSAVMAEKKTKKSRGNPTVYTVETFRALGWNEARKVAGAMYKVKANDWDELVGEFMAAQEKALEGSREN